MRFQPGWLLLLVFVDAATARAQARSGELQFVIPEGFVVLGRNGVPIPGAALSPGLRALAEQRVRLIAARVGNEGNADATFQVTVNNRPYEFNASTIDQFASELVAGFAGGGLTPEVRHKDTTMIAGRESGRVALVASGRRMLFYAVPDGRRTALLLYAASESEFPKLYPAFERSALATHVAPAAAQPEPPLAAPLATPAAAPPVRTPGRASGPGAATSSSDLGWIAIVVLTAAAVIATVALLRRKRPSPTQKRAHKS